MVESASGDTNGKLCNSLNSILFIVRIDYPTLSGRCVVEVCCC